MAKMRKIKTLFLLILWKVGANEQDSGAHAHIRETSAPHAQKVIDLLQVAYKGENPVLVVKLTTTQERNKERKNIVINKQSE